MECNIRSFHILSEIMSRRSAYQTWTFAHCTIVLDLVLPRIGQHAALSTHITIRYTYFLTVILMLSVLYFGPFSFFVTRGRGAADAEGSGPAVSTPGKPIIPDPPKNATPDHLIVQKACPGLDITSGRPVAVRELRHRCRPHGQMTETLDLMLHTVPVHPKSSVVCQVRRCNRRRWTRCFLRSGIACG